MCSSFFLALSPQCLSRNRIDGLQSIAISAAGKSINFPSLHFLLRSFPNAKLVQKERERKEERERESLAHLYSQGGNFSTRTIALAVDKTNVLINAMASPITTGWRIRRECVRACVRARACSTFFSHDSCVTKNLPGERKLWYKSKKREHSAKWIGFVPLKTESK